MNLALILLVAGLIFLAEIPDKTALASMLLGTRFHPGLVFVGVAAAFAVHVTLAVAAGSLLRLLPHRPLELVVAVLFAAGAALLLRGRHPDEPGEERLRRPLSPPRVVATSFGIVLVAEFGDLTQILTADLAARYHDPVSVGLGAAIGLWSVAALAIVGGGQLLRVVPLTVITRSAAAVMLVLAVLSALAAL